MLINEIADRALMDGMQNNSQSTNFNLVKVTESEEHPFNGLFSRTSIRG